MYIAIQGLTRVFMGVHENTCRGLQEYPWVYIHVAIQRFTGEFIAIYGMSYNPGDYMVSYTLFKPNHRLHAFCVAVERANILLPRFRILL